MLTDFIWINITVILPRTSVILENNDHFDNNPDFVWNHLQKILVIFDAKNCIFGSKSIRSLTFWFAFGTSDLTFCDSMVLKNGMVYSDVYYELVNESLSDDVFITLRFYDHSCLFWTFRHSKQAHSYWIHPKITHSVQ